MNNNEQEEEDQEMEEEQDQDLLITDSEKSEEPGVSPQKEVETLSDSQMEDKQIEHDSNKPDLAAIVGVALRNEEIKVDSESARRILIHQSAFKMRVRPEREVNSKLKKRGRKAMPPTIARLRQIA